MFYAMMELLNKNVHYCSETPYDCYTSLPNTLQG